MKAKLEALNESSWLAVKLYERCSQQAQAEQKTHKQQGNAGDDVVDEEDEK